MKNRRQDLQRPSQRLLTTESMRAIWQFYRKAHQNWATIGKRSPRENIKMELEIIWYMWKYINTGEKQYWEAYWNCVALRRVFSNESTLRMRWPKYQSFSLSIIPSKLEPGGKGDDRGWDGWMASLTRWMWVWVNSGSWWWTGRPGVLRFMGSQGVGHDWVTGLNWRRNCWKCIDNFAMEKK